MSRLNVISTHLETEVAWRIPALPAALADGERGRLKTDVNARVLGLHDQGLRRPGRHGPGLLPQLAAARHRRRRGPRSGPGPGPGPDLRARKPEAHARIGLGDEAYRPEKAAESAESADSVS